MKIAGTHTLLHPIEIEKKVAGSDEVTVEELKASGFEVEFRRPKAKDLRAFDRHEDAEIAAIIDLIASCTNLSLIEAENLDADDFTELGNALAPSGVSGPKTGEPA